jgi:hypothetical protein
MKLSDFLVPVDTYNSSYIDGSLALKANNASLGLYVQKSGDTMTGPLIINSSLGIGKIPTFVIDVSGDIAVNSLRVGRGSGNKAENVAIGYQALDSNTTGGLNVAIGRLALKNNLTGEINVALGAQTLQNATKSYNTGIGGYTLLQLSTGGFNTAIGANALASLTDGSNNIGIGFQAGQGCISDADNVLVGNNIGTYGVGNYNVFVGNEVGFSGGGVSNKNVVIGYQAGSNISGNGNIFLGYQSGYNEFGSNRLYIANSDTASPLIYGQFDTSLVRINGTLNVTSGLVISANGLKVTGDVSIYGVVHADSHVHVGGNLTVDGSLIYTNIQSINVSTGFIQLSTGIIGVPPSTLQSGIIVNRGTSDPYIFVYDEDGQNFRIGIATISSSTHYNDSSTQAVATREDTPTSFGVPFWNAPKYRFDTSAGFIFTPGSGLSVPGNINMDLEWSYILGKNIKISGNSGGTGNLFLQPDGGRVGIGISNAPEAALHISDTAGYTDLYLQNTSTGGITWAIESMGNIAGRRGNLEINVPGLYNAITCTSMGNVGISTTHPDMKFAVDGDVSISGNTWIKGMSSATSSNVVYYQSDGKLTKGAAPSGGGGNVAWANASIGMNNQIITAAGDASIVAEGNLTFDGQNFVSASTNYFYLGATNANGSWRWYIEPATGDLLFEKRIAGTWTYKSKIS